MTKTIKISDISGKPATHTISWERDTGEQDAMDDTITETVTYDLTCEEMGKVMSHLVAWANNYDEGLFEGIIECLQEEEQSKVLACPQLPLGNALGRGPLWYGDPRYDPTRTSGSILDQTDWKTLAGKREEQQ